MAKLKLGPIANDKPVKVTVELPAGLHRHLTAYADILAHEAGQPATDRGFAKSPAGDELRSLRCVVARPSSLHGECVVIVRRR